MPALLATAAMLPWAHERQSGAAFTQPCSSGYEGPVFIQGTSQDAEIKITDVSGASVHEMEAAGGQAQWDGTKLDGHPVASGYLVIPDDLGTSHA